MTVARPQQRLMLQGLLRDRFGLILRSQPMDVPVYALDGYVIERVERSTTD